MIIEGEAENAREAQKALRVVASFVAKSRVVASKKQDPVVLTQLSAMEQEIKVLDCRLGLLGKRED